MEENKDFQSILQVRDLHGILKHSGAFEEKSGGGDGFARIPLTTGTRALWQWPGEHGRHRPSTQQEGKCLQKACRSI